MLAQEAQGDPFLRLIAIAEGGWPRLKSTKRSDLQSKLDLRICARSKFMHVHATPIPLFRDLAHCEQLIL
jgi:hypothetical protein